MATIRSSLIGLVLLTGCATPPRVSYDTLAWDRACQQAPLHAGQSLTHQTVQAMQDVGAFAISVERLNDICAAKHRGATHG